MKIESANGASPAISAVASSDAPSSKANVSAHEPVEAPQSPCVE